MTGVLDRKVPPDGDRALHCEETEACADRGKKEGNGNEADGMLPETVGRRRVRVVNASVSNAGDDMAQKPNAEDGGKDEPEQIAQHSLRSNLM